MVGMLLHCPLNIFSHQSDTCNSSVCFLCVMSSFYFLLFLLYLIVCALSAVPLLTHLLTSTQPLPPTRFSSYLFLKASNEDDSGTSLRIYSIAEFFVICSLNFFPF